MITPRQYQEVAIEATLRHFEEYDHPFIIVMPTGSGKSIVISEICHRLNEPVLILQPTKEILIQNFTKLCSYGVMDVDIFSASMNRKKIGMFTYATIGSIYKKPELFKHFKYVIVDECHLVDPANLTGMYNSFFKAIGAKYIVGLTATPYRMVQSMYYSGDYIGNLTTVKTINRIPPFFFRKIAYQVSIEELLKRGYLSPLEYIFYDELDLSELKVNSTGADYDEMSLMKFWNSTRMVQTSQLISTIDAQCKHNIIFCSTIEQAETTSKMLTEMGLSSDFVSSKHETVSRDRIISHFRKGIIKHLANVGVLTMGFDFPELDCITLARPTMSLGLLYQMVGRGFRPAPNKERCLVYDLTSNIKRLGKVETIKVVKEPHGYRDIVTTEIGEITNKPLTSFHTQRKVKQWL